VIEAGNLDVCQKGETDRYRYKKREQLASAIISSAEIALLTEPY
jgi:hypothetical protein